MIRKKFPGGGGNSPQFPAIPAVVGGSKHILSVLRVFSDQLRMIFAFKSIHNVTGALRETQSSGGGYHRDLGASRDFRRTFPYCNVLAPGWGWGRFWCHEHVSDRSGRENHAQMIGKHSQNAQNVSTTSHERGNCREPRGTAPTIGELFLYH